MFRTIGAIALIATMAVASSGTAATIDITTGTSGGSVLAQGATDSNWQISVQGGAFTDAKVAYDAQICCGMSTVAGTAAWITDPSVVAGNSLTGWGVDQNAVLKTTFDLTGAKLSTVIMDGIWRFADNTIDISLNGNSIAGAANTTWGSDRTLATVNSGFVAGVNTLTFTGSSINSTWDGLWFDGQVTYDVAAVPVPASLPLMLVGLGALGFVRRKVKS